MKTNFGLIQEDPRLADHFLGEERLQGTEVWKPIKSISSGVIDWVDNAPENEIQKKGNVETNACVPFSGDNTAEYIINEQMAKDDGLKITLDTLGMLKNELFNASDRRTAKGSGTDPFKGNTVRAVDDYFRNFFFCPEDMWPFPDGMTREEYYGVMPAEVADFGKKLKGLLAIYTKYLPTSRQNMFGLYSSPEQILNGLMYSPVWASIDGGDFEGPDGLVRGEVLKQAADRGIKNYSHRITVRGAVLNKYFVVHDSYLNQIRRFDWNYPFGGCKIMKVDTTIPDTSPYISVGNQILFLAKGGKHTGKYISFGDGDIAKSLFTKYSEIIPRAKFDKLPSNFAGTLRLDTPNGLFTFLGSLIS